MRVLVANASGTQNLGDIAITQVLLERLTQNKDTVTIHGFVKRKDYGEVNFNKNIYKWAWFDSKNNLIKLWRLWTVWMFLMFGKRLAYLPSELKNILMDYENADLVCMVGGGYFRSRPGLKQQLNALMCLVPILVAKKYNKRVEIRPISFGPFGSKLTQRICGKLVNRCDKVLVRDKVSFKLLKKYVAIEKIRLVEDEAFGLRYENTNPKKQVVGFSVRDWGKATAKKRFPQKFANLVAIKAKKEGLNTIVPIIQANVPHHGEGDKLITRKVMRNLEKMGFRVLEPVVPVNVAHALEVFGQLSYLVGMRMHACIFAVIAGTKCTAVAYEHKHHLLDRKIEQVIDLKEL